MGGLTVVVFALADVLGFGHRDFGHVQTLGVALGLVILALGGTLVVLLFGISVASRIAGVILALVSVPLLALAVSFNSCDEFAVFEGEGGLGSEKAKRHAQEWADDRGSRPGCRLIQARAQNGVAKAQ